MGKLEFSGTVWPNGEFSVGRIKRVGLDRLWPSRPTHEAVPIDWHTVHRDGSVTFKTVTYWKPIPGNSPLGSSLVSNSHTPKKQPVRRGLKGITGLGKKMVRNGAYLLQKKVGKNRVTFFTGTLPSVTREQSIEIGRNWAEIVRIFYQKVQRKLRSKGLGDVVVGVTEIQEERYERDGVLALHVHAVWEGRSPGGHWAFTPQEYRDMWRSSVVSRVPEVEQAYWGASTRVESVNKSVEGYLGKYMSKGLKVSDGFPEDMKEGLPRTWYNLSRSARNWVYQSRCKSQALGELLWSAVIDLHVDCFSYLKTVELPLEGGWHFVLGYCGRFRSMNVLTKLIQLCY